jgi:DNA repair exonuclease SbcCD ATPase subunit
MQVVEKIINDTADINRIFFLSDIHIPNENEKDKKYYSVFENLFNQMKKLKIGKNDLICICGDIMDNGFSVSPTAIKMVKFLYHNLTEMTSVINILGNHEYKSALDSLTPIVDYYFPTKNGNYILMENGIYIYGNIAFGHTRFDSPEVTPCKKYNKKYTTIGLFHGIMNGSKIENGQIGRSHFSISNFKEYKYCGFGDLHMFQFLNKNETAFYVGSLIEQKRSESWYEHGFCVLDVKKGKIDFHAVQNIYKFIDIKIENGEIPKRAIDYIIKNNTEYADIQIEGGSDGLASVDHLKEFMKKHKITFGVKYKPTSDIIDVDTSITIGKKIHKISDIKSIEDFKTFLLKFINSKYKLKNTKRMSENITDLLEKSMIAEELFREKSISIISFKIKNIMIFCDDTELNFENIEGIIGICETNSMGKSTLCEYISITLHGKSPRCSNELSFIRNNKDECEATVILKMNNVLYEITRKIKTHGESKKDTYLYVKKYLTKTKYIVYTNDKIYEKKNKNDMVYKKTDEIKKIINDILTYDEIYQMFVISQEREKSIFTNEKNIELLFEASNLGYINKIAETCSQSLKTMKTNITTMLNREISPKFKEGFKSNNKDLDNCKKLVEHIVKKVDDYEKINDSKEYTDEFLKISKNYEKTKEELVKYEERLNNYHEFDDVDEDFEELENDNNELSNKININNKEILKIKKNNDNDMILKNDNCKKIKKYGDMEKKYERFEKEKEKNISDMKKNIDELKNKIYGCKQIKKSDYDEAIRNNKKYKNDIIQISENIKSIEEKVKIHNNVKDMFLNYKQYTDLFNEMEVCDKIINIFDTIPKKEITKKITDIIKKLTNDKKKFEINIKKYEQCKKDYENYDPYENVHEDLLKLHKQKNEFERKIKLCDDVINNYNICNENDKIKEEILKMESKIDDEEEKKIDNYDDYIKFMKENEIIEKRMNAGLINIEKIQNEIDKFTNIIDKNNGLIEKIKNNREKYDKYMSIRKEHNAFLKKYQIIKKEYDNKKIDIDKKEVNRKHIIGDIAIARNIIEKLQNDINKIDDYTIVHDCLKVNGLADTLLKNIIDNLQNALDQMCSYIDHEKININLITSYDNKMKKYNIVIRTPTVKDVMNAGGFKSKIMELIFKVAFLKINTSFKSDFIIIDEIYDACSVENFQMVKKLIEFFKMNYTKMFVVSHNPNIINLFDKKISIHYDQVNGNKIIQ